MTTPLVVSSAALIAVPFAVLGTSKIRAVPSMQARAAQVGFSVGAYQRIGVLEVAGAAGVMLGLAMPPLGLLAAAGLLLLVAYLWLAFGEI
ncbi:DoxX-like protein [Kribbella steppae]|uniref:DoxX-like protein n=1 Tax=Kribbella steppae TaxID=2512223 RepID=A0A4R2HFK7_9ACTN|nr:DoxX family protein [Kribbella steppae]TCO28033.1 DoxX-like protein [Kribbella steppae]